MPWYHFIYCSPPSRTDWVQNAATATTKWSDIGEWDTSGVGDFSLAFSTRRNQEGSIVATDDNPKAAVFVGTAISKWDTASVTTLYATFFFAGAMNADLSKWQVGKVVSLKSTFSSASKFAGTGLDSWITASVTNLEFTFQLTAEMNADLSGWSVGKLLTLRNTFNSAPKFIGTGLHSWDTSSVTTLHRTFNGAGSMKANLGGWSTAQGEY